MAWTPTHLVPAGGLAAWDAPDPTRQPIAVLPENVELAVETRSGDWALVGAENGWRGWVDARRLIAATTPALSPEKPPVYETPVQPAEGAVLEPGQPGYLLADGSTSSGAEAELEGQPRQGGRDLRLPVLAGMVGLIVVMVAALFVAGILPPKSGSGASGAASASPTGGAISVAASQTPAATTGPATPAPTLLPVDPEAAAMQDLMVSVIKQVGPSVVVIETDQGLGSGVIYDTKGDIVTNAHVVGTSTSFQVTLADGHQYTGTLVGSYTPDDIAVVHISATGLTPATFGDSSQLSVGDFVMAMGNPLGLQSSVTEGIVSALGRQVSEPAGNALPDAIQTSAAINPGNSGGALVDLSGDVVGIPTLEATDPQIGGAAAGIGFAISSNRAKFIADQLISTGKVTNSGRAYMGVQIQDSLSGGALVVSVVAGGPADKAGIVAGDTITAIDGQSIPDSETLIEDTAAHHPGDVVIVAVTHQDGTTASVSVTLGTLPS